MVSDTFFGRLGGDEQNRRRRAIRRYARRFPNRPLRNEKKPPPLCFPPLAAADALDVGPEAEAGAAAVAV